MVFIVRVTLKNKFSKTMPSQTFIKLCSRLFFLNTILVNWFLLLSKQVLNFLFIKPLFINTRVNVHMTLFSIPYKMMVSF